MACVPVGGEWAKPELKLQLTFSQRRAIVAEYAHEDRRWCQLLERSGAGVKVPYALQRRRYNAAMDEDPMRCCGQGSGQRLKSSVDTNEVDVIVTVCNGAVMNRSLGRNEFITDGYHRRWGYCSGYAPAPYV